MESIPFNHLIQVTQEQIIKVRECYGATDKGRIKESIKVIDEWLKKQDHLAEAAKYLDFAMIERMFLTSKLSIEMTKMKLDKLFTLRSVMPDLCQNLCIDEFDNYCKSVIHVPLQKLNPYNMSRVIVTKARNENWEDFNIQSYMRYSVLVGDYRFTHDYAAGDQFILDLKDIGVSIFTKFNPVTLKKGEILCTEGYGMKIKGIHLLNAPPFVDKLVSVIKQCLSEKVANRVHVHNTYEELHKEIAKEILPKEYGGDGPSCEDLANQWQETLHSKEGRKVIDVCSNFVSDESKRSCVKLNEDYLGIPGSFRALVVD